MHYGAHGPPRLHTLPEMTGIDHSANPLAAVSDRDRRALAIRFLRSDPNAPADQGWRTSQGR